MTLLKSVFLGFLIVSSAFTLKQRDFVEDLSAEKVSHQKTKMSLNKPGTEQIKGGNFMSDNVPLFLLARINHPMDSIKLTTIRKLYCNNTIYTYGRIKGKTDTLFSCVNHNKIISRKSLISLSKSRFILTDIDHLNPRYKVLKVNNIDFFEKPIDYPLYTSISKSTRSSFNLITKLTITGVTAITRGTGMAADRYGPDFLIQKVKHEFKTSDLVHLSNEVSIVRNYRYGRTLRFATKERDIKVLLKLNPRIIVELTGNHNRDYGNKPFLYTLKWYKNHGVKTFGGGANPQKANKPLILRLKDGTRLAFIGYNQSCPLRECAKRRNEPGANPYGRQKARKTLMNLKKQGVDFIIASVQFDERNSYRPTASQKAICKNLIDFGADMVYGSQAHQIQRLEYYKNKPIYYGLGNFLFDQISKPGLRQGMFLHLYFLNGRLLQVKPVFTHISNRRRPVLATKKQQSVIMKHIYKEKLLYNSK